MRIDTTQFVLPASIAILSNVLEALTKLIGLGEHGHVIGVFNQLHRLGWTPINHPRPWPCLIHTPKKLFSRTQISLP